MIENTTLDEILSFKTKRIENPPAQTSLLTLLPTSSTGEHLFNHDLPTWSELLLLQMLEASQEHQC
jgi:hypothetical protein